MIFLCFSFLNSEALCFNRPLLSSLASAVAIFLNKLFIIKKSLLSVSCYIYGFASLLLFSLSCIFTLSFLSFSFLLSLSLPSSLSSSLFLSSSTSLFSLIFWFMVKFFHLHQKVLGFMIFPKTKSLIFFRCSPFILFFEFSQIFFYIPSSHIFICAYLSYYIHVDYFLLIYLFPYIFININIGYGHSVNKKKKKYFGCVRHHRYIHNDSHDSPPPILPYCIECSTILKPLHIPQLTHFHQPLCHCNIYSPQTTSSANIQCSFL